MASVTSLKADLGEYLREQRHSARLSLRQLADLAGVSNPYLSQIERGLKKPSAEILQQLAKGLRISAESLYVRAGILDEQDDRQLETKSAILTDPLLAERQKRVLLDIYDAFCAENLRAAPAANASHVPDAPDAADTVDAVDVEHADPQTVTGTTQDAEPGTGTHTEPGTGTERDVPPESDATTEPGRTARKTRQGRVRTARTTRTTTSKGSS
jgi:transcriptional regulator with XRE-family HTH domain